MQLTLTTSHTPASDLGYLLHKNPFKVQEFALSFGKAHIFYTEATAERCSATLLIDLDPIALVRNHRRPSGNGGLFDQYVNDRPYVASSFLSVAIGDVYRSALGGRSADRPDLVDKPIPLVAEMPVVPSRGGERLLRALFEPLGYDLKLARLQLDEKFPEWGDSTYFSVSLSATVKLKDLLSHLYVLIPVLDNEKHYWVGDDEVEKLLRHGGDWLAIHPEKEQIAKRYLKHRRSLAREALGRLVVEDGGEVAESVASTLRVEREANLEAPISLNERRIRQVLNVLRDISAATVLDLGCGEGKLISALLKEKVITSIVGLDVSMRSLEIAKDRLNLDRLPTAVRNKLEFLHGSLTYRDRRLEGFEAATVIEVIEHLDAARLAAFERVLFEFSRPRSIIVTTPNAEYNVKFSNLPSGQFRHPDHRFEWTRKEFSDWANRIAARFGYSARCIPIGDEDPVLGAPTQMALFQVT
jgi:3' terminal RNA ribose 2'-O-methyltransferase Hen1